MRSSTRQKIIDSAFKVFAADPWASMEKVAERCGIARATLFRYFPGKSVLIQTLQKEAYLMCLSQLKPFSTGEGCARARLEQAVGTLVPLGSAFSFLIDEQVRRDDPELAALEEAYLEEWRRFLTEVQNAGGIADDVPIAWAVSALEGLLSMALVEMTRGNVTAKQASAWILRTFRTGLQTK